MALDATVISKIPVTLLCITTTNQGPKTSKGSVTEQILQTLGELNNMALMNIAHVSFFIYKMQ